MMEMKGKLVILRASAEECRDRGQSFERQDSFNRNISIKFSPVLETKRVDLISFII